MLDLNEIPKKVYETQVWRSIFRHAPWKDAPRDRMRHIVDNIWLHLHPARIRPRAVKVSYSWGLGGISFMLYLILTVTGVLLMFYYRPTVELAYQDMKDLEFAVTLGKFLRNAHRWSAHAMVLIVILHMVRVFLTGAYKKPREFNWGIGVLLLSITLFLSFTGYLLPWDQLAIWAVTVGTNMAGATPFMGNEGPFSGLLGMRVNNDVRFVLLGGTTVGASTLIRFYVLHCVLVPLVAGALMIVHFWRVRKDSFSAAPLEADEQKLDVWPHLIVREYLAAALTILAIFLWSVLQNAPLEELANPTVTPNPSKAPWYFVGLQELLVYFDPWIAGVLIPNVIIAGLIAMPFIDVNPKGVGYYSLRERPLANVMFLSGVFLWFLLIFIGYFCRGPNWGWYWPWESWLAHKPLPPPTWDLPAWAGGALMIFYMAFGMAAPRLIGGEISWSRAIGAFAAVFLLAAGGLKIFTALAAAKLLMLGLFVFIFFLLGFLFPQRYLKGLDLARYALTMSLILMMLGVLLKIGLRLGFDIKYVLSLPQFNFNI
ncbi:MAG: cytochrome b N-terminal domain-containing protein [Elusimicrobia bacterium]|nr:cytochrome b N-terminal domain-containing protein [Elusimicrobiota bacterium]